MTRQHKVGELVSGCAALLQSPTWLSHHECAVLAFGFSDHLEGSWQTTTEKPLDVFNNPTDSVCELENLDHFDGRMI
jgi:hypothetical protein